MENIKSISQLWGTKSRPTTPYQEYESALYEYKENPRAAEALKYLILERKLSLTTIQAFRVGYNQEQHEIAIPVFKDGELIDYKYRGITEKTFRRHPGSETWVVNERAFQYAEEDGYIVCVEGEFDAMALWNIGIRSVISTTGGSQGATPWVTKIPDKIKVYICYDNDDAGQDAAQKLAERIGIERCYNIVLSVKDPNDFIREGHTKEEFEKILNDALRFKIKDVYKISDILDSLENNKIKRVPTFSKRLTAHLDGGIPKKSLVVVSGRSGVGKTTAMSNMLIDHANNGMPCLLVSLENDLFFTIQRILEIKYGKPYTTFTKKDWSIVRSDMADYPLYIDVSMDSYTIDKISKIIDQAKKLYGIEFFGFDHIGFLPTRDDPREISQMVRAFKLLARKHDIIVYMISHVRRASNPTDYLTQEELKNSSSIGQDSDIVLFVVDTKAGLEISIDKARMSKSHVRIPIIFDGPTGVMKDDMERSAKHYDSELVDPVIQDTDKDNQKDTTPIEY